MWSFWTSMNWSSVPAWPGSSAQIAHILLCKSCYFCPLEEVNWQAASRLGLSDSTVRRWGGGRSNGAQGWWRNQRYKSQMTSPGDIQEPLNRLFQIFTVASPNQNLFRNLTWSHLRSGSLMLQKRDLYLDFTPNNWIIMNKYYKNVQESSNQIVHANCTL